MKNDMIILVLILIVAGLAVTQVFSPVGFTTLALSQADFQSNHPFFNGKTWILTVAQQGLGQHAVGTIDASDIGSKSGQTPINDLTIDITFQEQRCEYPINKDSNALQVKKYTYYNYNYDIISGCTQQNALAACPSMAFYGKEAFSFGCFCINEVLITGAVAPAIGNPNVHTVSTISVSNGPNTESKNIDTSGLIDTKIGNNVYVAWDGNLVKGSCDNQAPYYGFYMNGQWYIGSASNYNQYVATYSATMNQGQLQGCGYDKSCMQNLIATVNSAADRSTTISNFGAKIDQPTSLTGAVAAKDLPSLIQVPVYTFYVKADWLGIYQPFPDPQIISVNSQKFQPGCNGRVQALIQNNGDPGNVNTWISCNSPFRISGSSTKTVSLGTGQSQTVYYDICVDTQSPIQGQCTVYAQALTKQVSKTVQVSADPYQICTPNVEECSGNARLKCNSYGSGRTTVQTCSQDEECRYDPGETTTQCVKKTTPPGPGGCEWWDIGCHLDQLGKDLSAWWTDFTTGAFAIVVAIAVILLLVVIITVKKGGV